MSLTFNMLMALTRYIRSMMDYAWRMCGPECCNSAPQIQKLMYRGRFNGGFQPLACEVKFWVATPTSG